VEIFTLHLHAISHGFGGWVSTWPSFVMVMFQRRPFARLCGLNPDSPTASTAFVANSCFVPANLPVGR